MSGAGAFMEEGERESPTFRDSMERPILKLSVKLIETYKHINKVYYEAKARKLKEQADVTRGGAFNDGYDDQNYDYILHGDEIFAERYILKHRIGKGSFGQVVCAYDQDLRCEVAIKIIKSRKPFMLQAQTEIELLLLMRETDRNDESNVVRLLHHFVYRNHQCLVFEMLSGRTGYIWWESVERKQWCGYGGTVLWRYREVYTTTRGVKNNEHPNA